MEIENGTSNAENTECSEAVQCLKSEAVNNEVADKNNVNGEVQQLKSEAVNNGVVFAEGNDVAEGDSGGVESIRTYKRRKHVKLISESKAQDNCRAYMEATSHTAEQVYSPLFSNYVLLWRPIFLLNLSSG